MLILSGRAIVLPCILLTIGFSLRLQAATHVPKIYDLFGDLPDVSQLAKYRFNGSLRVYSKNRKLIAEFGSQRRLPVDYVQIPKKLVYASIAAEEKPLLRTDPLTNSKLSKPINIDNYLGVSIFSLVLAKNISFFTKNSFARKVFLLRIAMKIEDEYSKEKIMEMYLNRIYMGQRSYGIAAAARLYYGKNLKDLTLAQMAMLGGLPKKPSYYNPVRYPKRAITRRNNVLRRMKKLKFISIVEYQTAIKQPLTAMYNKAGSVCQAPYVAEMVRQEIRHKYGNTAYRSGYNVYTTINCNQQMAARKSLRTGLLDYSLRHGYRGPIKNLLSTKNGVRTKVGQIDLLKQTRAPKNLTSALVSSVTATDAKLFLADSTEIKLSLKSVKWARKYISATKTGPEIKQVTQVLKLGDIVYVIQNKNKQWSLAQEPLIQGALISIDPSNGAIRSLVGGFDFSSFKNSGKFNRATKLKRFAGLTIAPLLYSAALQHGFNNKSIITANPLPKAFIANRGLGQRSRQARRLRLLNAMLSQNELYFSNLIYKIGLTSIRRLFSLYSLEANLNISMALGQLEITPLKFTRIYSSFANQGLEINPFIINRITQRRQGVLYQAKPKVACNSCVDSNTNLQSNTNAKRLLKVKDANSVSFLLSVELRRALTQVGIISLKLNGKFKKNLLGKDLALKVGSKQQHNNGWAVGYNSRLVTTVWVGFDKYTSMGNKESSYTTALPIWVDYMNRVLKSNVP